LGQWDRDITKAARRAFQKLLVAGRCDRGGLMVSRESIENFRQERGFAGYLETSALSGAGCTELRDAIIQNIAWEQIPWTSSPRTFKLLKDVILKIKDEGKALLRMSELKQQVEMRLPEESFTMEELRSVVGLLAGPGIVWQLEFGDIVLLQPERINAYASAVIRSVRKHTEEIGAVLEEDVLSGKLDYQDMKRLSLEEERIVLRAMHQILIDHGLCLRENSEKGPLLVFPSYFKRERPELGDYPAIFVTYEFSGALDEIYATLVVRLHYSTAFERDRLWRFAADFKTQAGKRLGFKMTKKSEGAAEITVYFETGIPDDTKVTFIRYIHDHLQAKDPNANRIRHYVCQNIKCGEPVESIRAIKKAMETGQKNISCQFCGQKILLEDLIEQKFDSEKVIRDVQAINEQVKIKLDNESRDLILIGHAFVIAGEAGQIFRATPNSDWGIDGEIEFKNEKGEASGKRLYLQLKSGDSYLYARQGDNKEIFTIKNPRHSEYWQAHEYPVMLVIRTSDGQIRWMNVTDYLKRHGKETKRIIFDGEPFTALNVARMRDKLINI
jgi:DNA-directed RNA polymerase subunit RPC12/RpoP